MSPTSDYREVTDTVTLRKLCGRCVLVSPRGHNWGYVRAVIRYAQDTVTWSVSYVDVRRIVEYRSCADLFKSLHIMTDLPV